MDYHTDNLMMNDVFTFFANKINLHHRESLDHSFSYRRGN